MPFNPNPYQIISCILFILIFIAILRFRRWPKIWSSNAALIAFLVIPGFTVFIFETAIGIQADYQALSALSLTLSLAGVGLTYIYRDQPDKAFKIMCISFTIITMSLISYKMLGTPTLLDWDERYYLSIAATASGGHGLYPVLQNYPPMPVMGGIGHGAWIYVLVYQILGPSLYSLRIVALLFIYLTLPAIFLLFRRWYGPVTAWLAVTLLPTCLLYTVTFSTRMDIFTIMCLWWGLLLVDIAREKRTWRWHLATGLYLGLCLQIHIHTSVMAIAVGILYLIDYSRQLRQNRQWEFPQAVVVYSIGALLGLGFFVIANILPNPDAFFRTAGNAGRFMVVSANPDAPLLERLVRSFTAIDVFWQNFVRRWILVLEAINPVELILWLAAFLSLFWRRSHRATLTTIVLSISVVMVGFFVLNIFFLIYTTHIGPALLLCVPPLFTYGFGRRASFDWQHVRLSLVLVLAACVLPIYMTTLRIDFEKMLASPSASPYADATRFVKEHVSTTCRVIGTDEMFVFDLPMYSLYYSGEAVSAGNGRRYYNYESNRPLWQSIDPDIAIVTDSLVEDLKTWLQDMKYEEIFPAVWQKSLSPLSDGCTVSP